MFNFTTITMLYQLSVLKDSVSLKSELQKIKFISQALKSGLVGSVGEKRVAIKNEIESLDKKYIFLKSKKSWLYSFPNGGWNSCSAVTIEEAIKGEKKRWKGDKKLCNFRLQTDVEHNALLSLFY